MKIIFGILASSNEKYNDFKNVWVNNIRNFKSGSNKDLIDFYFIYHEKLDDKSHVENCGDFYDYYSKYEPKISMMDSCVTRSLELMKHVVSNGHFDYFIRTNLSTLFDLSTLLNWATFVPKKNFIAGSVIDRVSSINTHLSGTNITLSRDLVEFILLNAHNILPESILPGDDQRLTSLIIENLDVDILLLKRIDFIEMKIGDNYLPPSIVFQSSTTISNLFCFRFKTLDRNVDIKYMTQLLNEIHSENFNLTDSLNRILVNSHYKKNFLQNPEYEELTCTSFRFSKTPETKHLYNYNGRNIIPLNDTCNVNIQGLSINLHSLLNVHSH